MPLYEYTCRACGAGFEKIRKYDDREKPTSCPSCGSEDAVPTFSVPGRVGQANGAGGSTATLPQTGTGGGCASGACGLW